MYKSANKTENFQSHYIIMKNYTVLVVIFLSILCCYSAASYAQQDSSQDDPAAQVAVEDQSVAEKDVSEYTDSELVELYLNDPNSLPEMDDEQLAHITEMTVQLQNTQSE